MSNNAERPVNVHISPSTVSFAAMTPAELQSFINEILSSNFVDNVQLLFESPIDNIISIRHYPFNVPMVSFNYASESDIVTVNSIVVNDVTINVANALMSNYAPYMIDLGGISITGDSDTFFDYSPYTQYELYLPYIGFVNLDADAIVGKYLNVKYAIDFNSGTATAYIQTKPSSGSTDTDYRIIMIKESKIGVDIPICGGSSAEIAKSLLNVGLSTAGAVTGIVGQAIASGLKGAADVGGALQAGINFDLSTSASVIQAAQAHIIRGETGNGYNALYGPSNMFLIKTSLDYYIPTSFNSMYGRISRLTTDMDEIGSGEGLVILENFHLDGFSTATSSELDMITAALKEGIIL